MKTIEIQHNGKPYTVSTEAKRTWRVVRWGAEITVSIAIDTVWVGDGLLTEQGQIVDCAAVLDEGAYEVIEAALAAAPRTGMGTAEKAVPERLAHLRSEIAERTAEVQSLIAPERASMLNPAAAAIERECSRGFMEASRTAIPKAFKITSRDGVDLGTYAVPTPLGALDAMAVTGGAKSHADACVITTADPDDWTTDPAAFRRRGGPNLFVQEIDPVASVIEKLEERALRSGWEGWGEWSEVLTWAGIAGCPYTQRTPAAQALLRALLRASVRVDATMSNMPVKFRAPLAGGVK